MKKYLKSMKTNIIYKVLNEDNTIKYIGSTDSVCRLNFHKGGFGKLDLNNNYGKIMYSEIKKINRIELYFIEYYLINKYNPTLNKEKGNLHDFLFIDERKVELIDIADELKYNDFI
ncbi:hypothetical protein [Clostridium estertheticum]|uniref:hypothetical protein n=1 Tax=Clostridium estertheticum TaxID=238834 RepID=UPI00124E885E|nr:hypothetical protein [Clostridium estertheticum]MBZ9616779.1 hypothetical protein [Clostridium estertheticum subsp. laramiense]WAG72486.1 hypothetical protein LL032_15175 [Clostridium estertheticum]